MENIVAPDGCLSKEVAEHIVGLHNEQLEEHKRLEAMGEIVSLWQNWWNTVGFEWYKDHGKPQHERPPMLQSGSEHHGKWLVDKAMVEGVTQAIFKPRQALSQ